LTEIHSIEVREGWKKGYLLFFLTWMFCMSLGFFIPEQRHESIEFFFGKWNFAKLPFISFFVLVPCISLFYYFDKRVKVRIDSNGIWSGKNGSFPWDDIGYFNSTVSKAIGDAATYKLYIRLKDPEGTLGKEVMLKFRRMDKSFDEIRTVVEYYANRFKIGDEGHESEV